jgi:hypothetical protein
MALRLRRHEHAATRGAAREITATNADANGRGGVVFTAGAARIQADEACEAVPHGRAVYTEVPAWR